MNPGPNKYYYFSYTWTGGHGPLGMANAVTGPHTEFDLVKSHKELTVRFKETIIILFWNEITKEQYDDFMDYVDEVDSGNKLPKILAIVKDKGPDKP